MRDTVCKRLHAHSGHRSKRAMYRVMRDSGMAAEMTDAELQRSLQKAVESCARCMVERRVQKDNVVSLPEAVGLGQVWQSDVACVEGQPPWHHHSACLCP